MKLGEDFVPGPSQEITGKESLASKWILHRLNKAIKDTNESMDQMNFMAVTSTIYNFWLYELCDVFIEVCKPVIDGTDEAAKRSARDTLYTCLDQGLRLMHPFMPFVTEELWQRLPRRPSDKTRSICLAAFPEVIPGWENAEAEKDYVLVNEALRAARSIFADYNIRSGGTVYVIANSQKLKDLFEATSQDFITLTKGCSVLKVLVKDVDAVPAGCVLQTINEEVNVAVLVKGLVNFDEEIGKIEKKLERVNKTMQTMKDRMANPTYEEKVKLEVRQQDSSKMAGYEAEVDALTVAMQNFLRLRDA